jgi:hypothetical protein
MDQLYGISPTFNIIKNRIHDFAGQWYAVSF